STLDTEFLLEATQDPIERRVHLTVRQRTVRRPETHPVGDASRPLRHALPTVEVEGEYRLEQRAARLADQRLDPGRGELVRHQEGGVPLHGRERRRRTIDRP